MIPQVFDPELSGEPQVLPRAVHATTPPQTHPRVRPRADLPTKKACNLDPMAPRSRQKRHDAWQASMNATVSFTEWSLDGCGELCVNIGAVRALD